VLDEEPELCHYDHEISSNHHKATPDFSCGVSYS